MFCEKGLCHKNITVLNVKSRGLSDGYLVDDIFLLPIQYTYVKPPNSSNPIAKLSPNKKPHPSLVITWGNFVQS